MKHKKIFVSEQLRIRSVFSYKPKCMCSPYTYICFETQVVEWIGKSLRSDATDRVFTLRCGPFVRRTQVRAGLLSVTFYQYRSIFLYLLLRGKLLHFMVIIKNYSNIFHSLHYQHPFQTYKVSFIRSL